MSWRRHLAKLCTVVRRSKPADDLDEEIRLHLRMEEQENLESGMSPEEAHYAALRRFGNVTSAQERSREMWGWNSVETLLQDVRYGLRQLRRSPGFTAVAVLTLALGIGANTAIFSLINTVMLRMLPVEKPDELLKVVGHGSFILVGNYFSNPLWEKVRDQQDVFSGVFAWGTDTLNLTRGGIIHPANGIWVSGTFFNTLGLRPAAGRLIVASDDRRGCPAVAVLSYGFWQEHYAGAASAIGSTLSLDSHPFEVIGVTRPGFYGMDVGAKFDVAVPICAAAISAIRSLGKSWSWLNVAGRIKPGISPTQLNERLRILSPRIFIAALFDDWWSPDMRKDFVKTTLVAAPAATGISDPMSGLRRQFNEPLYILMAVVGLVLLIASANIASLMLARGAARHKEIAMRQALGASRIRLVRQLLTECILLSSAGALSGILFARWGAALLVLLISTTRNAVFLDLSLDGRALGFTAAIAAVTTLVFGLLPALRSTRVSLTSAMKGSQALETGRPMRFGTRRWIVASQVALSLVLLVAAGLLLRSFARLAVFDLGFDRNNVLLVNANLQVAKVPKEQQLATFDEIESRLRALPGVVSAGQSLYSPMQGGAWIDSIQSKAPSGDEVEIWVNGISPGFLGTLRMPILAGRNFNNHDTKTSPWVAIVNQTVARRCFPGLNPVGRTFRFNAISDPSGTPIEVVGVVRDSPAPYDGVFNFDQLRGDPYATVFLPLPQVRAPHEADNFELRTARRPSALATAVQAAVAGVNKEIPLQFHTLADEVNDSMIQERLLALLSAFFGALALLLAMIGLYGTLSYLVNQRRTEFGVRMALGAGSGSILRLVIRDVIAVLAAGIVVGVCISLAATRVLQQMLFELGPRDVTTMIAAAGVLSVVALIAGYLPARRATKVDPMVALRYE